MGKTVAVVQARMGSTRLPDKVLLPLGDRCVLQWVLDRLSNAQRLDQIVVATSVSPSDDAISAHCQAWGITCFRGSENDVLGRFAQAAVEANADLVVRINADNPLIDPKYIDELVADIRKTEADYASFRLRNGRPIILTGLSFFAEIVTRACLEQASRTIKDPFEREHVTLGIYNRPSEFAVQFKEVPEMLNVPELRLTLDTAEDYAMLQQLVLALNGDAISASAERVVLLINDRPDWKKRMAELNRQNPKVRGPLA